MSLSGTATVDNQLGTGDEGRFVRAQEQPTVTNILGSARTAGGHPSDAILPPAAFALLKWTKNEAG